MDFFVQEFEYAPLPYRFQKGIEIIHPEYHRTIWSKDLYFFAIFSRTLVLMILILWLKYIVKNISHFFEEKENRLCFFVFVHLFSEWPFSDSMKDTCRLFWTIVTFKNLQNFTSEFREKSEPLGAKIKLSLFLIDFYLAEILIYFRNESFLKVLCNSCEQAKGVDVWMILWFYKLSLVKVSLQNKAKTVV